MCCAGLIRSSACWSARLLEGFRSLVQPLPWCTVHNVCLGSICRYRWAWPLGHRLCRASCGICNPLCLVLMMPTYIYNVIASVAVVWLASVWLLNCCSESLASRKVLGLCPRRAPDADGGQHDGRVAQEREEGLRTAANCGGRSWWCARDGVMLTQG